MKAIVVTTITTILDIDKMEVQGHTIDIDDQDGLSEVSLDVLGALVVGGMTSGLEASYKRWPRLKPDSTE